MCIDKMTCYISRLSHLEYLGLGHYTTVHPTKLAVKKMDSWVTNGSEKGALKR